MKKKTKIIIAVVAVILCAVLFVPIPGGGVKDGGTREFTSLTYKIVKWNRLTGGGVYDKTKIYFFPKNFKSLDGLWSYEEGSVLYSFNATVLEINGNTVTVEPLEGEDERRSSDKISFGYEKSELTKAGISEGSLVTVSYSGDIAETYPAQITAKEVKLATELRDVEYIDVWVDKGDCDNETEDGSYDVIIKSIYKDCFFAESVIPLRYEMKFNCTLSDEWCVGDQVLCEFENAYFDDENNRMEAYGVTVKESTFEMQEGVAYKPVIYLYPEKEMPVAVELLLNGTLTCTYPEYNGGWSVTASPDGALKDESGQSYNYLYWEGDIKGDWDFSEGFCVKGEDTAAFLENTLSRLGLTRREANEFIVFWLPKMQANEYNIISFQGEEYENAAKLNISPQPDTVIRVFMTYKASDEYVDLPEQELTSPERKGFCVVEWGGSALCAQLNPPSGGAPKAQFYSPCGE